MKVVFILDGEVCFTNKENISLYSDAEIIKEITIDRYNELQKIRDNEYFLYEKNKEIKYCKRIRGINIVFDKEKECFIETASLEEQIEHYKNIIIEKTREHELLKVSGFTGTQEEINLKTEIENLKQIYMDKNHELALQIENRLRKKK